LFLNL